MQAISLILRNHENGVNFERLYYQAICLGEIEQAERLYAEYQKEPVDGFWRDAFRALGLSETILMASVVNYLNMPFGSYVFRRLEEQEIEIVPWLYGDNNSKQVLVDALREDKASVDTLNTYSRTLMLTADFLEWLNKYNQTAAKKEASHG